MKTAAIYSRVSSDRQKEEQTIVSQTAALIEYAQGAGYVVPEEWIFEDEGYSGAVLVRPGLERIRDLVSEGQLETILVYSPDRLSRRYAYQVLLLEEFSRQGTSVEFVTSPQASTPEEHLLLQFQGMIAEYERAQIAERCRRGKRHRAKCGSVNVLSGAPYGYRYIKKTETSAGYYEVVGREAEVVEKVFQLYTKDKLSIGAIARWLNDHGLPTRKNISPWERSTVWGMLRNPAYKGKACFGKTEQKEREKVTRSLRKKGGYSSRCSASRERPREEWIEIPVTAIVDDDTFALAQEQLEANKRHSRRRTIEPTLLQGMLVCSECGYAFSRTSTRTTRKKIYYYRCIGSDNYRFPNGRVCSSRPIRQDYLDDVVWGQVMHLLESPDLIRVEINRRLDKIRKSDPVTRRKESIIKEMARLRKGIEKLLDAYQEDLLQLAELRRRMPELRKREATLKSELRSLEAAEVDQQAFLQLANNLEDFLGRLRESSKELSVIERQKILRLLVKEILVDKETIKVKHSIPVTNCNSPIEPSGGGKVPSYLLCKGSHFSDAGEHDTRWS